MMLASGSKLGPYEIQLPLGAGGMGEVYRARDSKLGRDVALKALPETFAQDPERMARLRREAQVLASLNHPNIAAIYGFEDSGSTHALVMELVEGPTLAERIKTGAIALEEALPIAKQICEALEYAHERGIVHRDLKPSNIKITADGQVKVLDFGLAKAIEGDASATSVENSPTLSAMATRAGFLLGTAAYMSPEQARGKAADRRADIWAFGVVLYELLSGRRLFTGETTSDTLAAVIRAEPDWSLLPSGTPQPIRALLRRCLQKDPRQRLQAIGDARIAIEETTSGTGESPSLAMAPETPRPRWLQSLPWALAALFAVAFAASFLVFPLALRKPPATAIVSEISPPANANLALSGNFSDPPALSPDGKWLAFGGPPTFGSTASGAQPQLWVRPLDSGAARPLAGTNGAIFPFWSPDSRHIGYFANGRLNRVNATGGPPLALADAPDNRGGSWGRDGSILFAAQSGPIYRVSDSGGTPQAVTKLNSSRQEVSHRWPQFLPDGKHFLFYAFSSSGENSGTYAASLAGGEPRLILRGSSDAVYASPGYLLYVSQGTLMAQAFNANKLRLTGDAVTIGEHAGVNLSLRRGVFAVSENGILCYGTGNPSGANSRLLWFDRGGKQIGEIGTPANYVEPSLSPDERQLAVAMLDPIVGSPSVWVYDLVRGTNTRLTFSPGVNAEPIWSPDGKFIAFDSSRGGRINLYKKAADGTGSTTPLFVDETTEYFPTWSPDGRYVIFQRLAPQYSHFELWALPLTGARKAFPVIQDKQFDATEAALSPNGKWLAYVSSESGRQEVYIVPFLHGNGKWLFSNGGGSWPQWRQDGKELFYLSPDNKLMTAQISEQGASLTIGQPAPLFQFSQASPSTVGRPYDVAADGNKFLVVSEETQNSSRALTLVTNWPALLKKQ